MSLSPCICETCGKACTKKSNLYAHIRTVHKTIPTYSRTGKLRCPIWGCDDKIFITYAELRKHLSVSHELQLEEEELSFPSEGDFLKWKTEMEKKETASYVHSFGWRKLASNKGKTTYLHCHRSGIFNSRSKGRRRMKSQGTNKIGANCPSGLHVTVNQDLTAHVMFYKTHCGHSCSSAHVNLQPEDRTRIADQLKSGLTMKKVLEDIRDSVLDGADDQSRLSLTNHQDLKNINRDFNLKLKERRNGSDFDHFISVKLDSLTGTLGAVAEDSPVLYTKVQGCDDPTGVLGRDDFMYFIMTKFQKEMLLKFGPNGKLCVEAVDSSNENDFQLNTLFTIDEFGSGCPVAFCISNRTDTTALQIFFAQVLDKVGKMEAHVLMTEDVPAYVNAWTSVMGPPRHHLLCSWHVDRNWRSQLTKVTGCKSKKALVYKAVRTLLQEPSIEQMLLLQSRLLEELYEDEETREFGQYFANHYAYRPDKWAYCYRIGVGIHTNTYFDSMHKVLKHIYLEGMKNKCPDKCVNALIKMSRDNFFERLIKITKKPPASRIRLIDQSHVKSLSFDVANITPCGEGVWEVRSSNNTDVKYKVTRTETRECLNCVSRCRECDICVHMFNCECIDNLINYNICEHIHATIRKTGGFVLVPSETWVSIETEECEQDEVADINQKLELCRELLLETEVGNESSHNIHRWLDMIIEEIQMEKVKMTSLKKPVSREPHKVVTINE